MAKKAEDPSLEIFANLRTILIFVVVGSTIVAFVEFQSQSAAERTYQKWDVAVKEKLEEGEYLSWEEFNSLISGFPKKSDSRKADTVEPEERSEDDSNGDTKEEDNSEAEEDVKKGPVGVTVDYIWGGLFTKSIIAVTMSSDDEPVIFRVSAIQH